MSAVLAVRFALGTRDGRVRTTLIALASGFAVALLLLAASVPGALAARDARSDARDPQLVQPAGARSLLWGDVDFIAAEGPVTGALMRQRSSTAPLPPGIAALPDVGTMLVSPALRSALTHDPILAARLPYRIAGTLPDAQLLGPTELRFLAADPLLGDAGGAGGVLHFALHEAPEPLDPVLALLVVVGVVVLLLPIAVVVVIAGRFGSERRDRRLAALRLAGMTVRATAQTLAVEALVGALAGVAVGIGVFVGARQLLRLIQIANLSVFPADAVPPAPLAAAVLMLVPLTVLGAALAGLRGVALEPLGVSRRTGRSPRRLWWRLGPLVAGALLLVSLDGTFLQERTGNVVLVAAGVTLLLVAAIALLPWLVERAARAVPGGGVPWRTARGRLVHEGGTTVRVVGAVCALTAGAIALQMLFAGLAAGYGTAGGTTVPTALVAGVPQQHALREAAELESVTPAVTVQLSTTVSGHSDRFVTLVVGTCRALAELASVPGCAPDRVFVTPGESFAAGGGRLSLGGRTWRVPTRIVPVDAVRVNGFNTLNGALLVPEQEIALTGSTDVDLYASSAEQRFPAVVTAARELDPLVQLTLPDVGATTHQFDAVRRGLTVGLVLVLLLVGGVLLVSVVDELRARRASLATLAAIGMRRRTMSASILWESAVPVLVGALVAAVAGSGLGLVLLRVMNRGPATDPLVLADVVLACVVPLAVTLLGLPLATRLMRPEGLRAE